MLVAERSAPLQIIVSRLIEQDVVHSHHNICVTEHEKIQAVVRIKDQAPLPLDPAHSALIVVDMQRYFVRPEYAWARTIERVMPGATEGYFARVNSSVLGNAQRLLGTFRSLRLP